MLSLASVLLICCGVLCVKDGEFAWRLYEWDCQLVGMTPPPHWQKYVNFVGIMLIGLGVVGFAGGIMLA